MALGISGLPAELSIRVMDNCDSLQDVWSLIQASPHVLRCYLANREYITQPHINRLRDICGPRVPASGFLAAQLRHIRGRLASNCDVENLEAAIRPAIEQYQPNKDNRPWPANLPLLSALTEVATATDLMTSRYALQAWERELRRRTRVSRCRVLHGWPPYPPGQEPRPLELSIAERHRFNDAFFRYEAFCQAFFRDGNFLFKHDEEFRRRVFTSQKRIARFYPAVYYILFQQRDTMENVFEERDNSSVSLSLTDYLHYQQRSSAETRHYLHYVTSQGLDLLISLQQMTRERRQNFILDTFRQAQHSDHSVTLIMEDNCRTSILSDCLIPTKGGAFTFQKRTSIPSYRGRGWTPWVERGRGRAQPWWLDGSYSYALYYWDKQRQMGE
ncbi:hypothetical protein NM208_g947 [Fusarium decemcellulare]|uniref:Uncharacterized protein n=1 Tax=Fusarium decemcellulare TaxID=57161 RepID=A0ACC1SY35_9HYPO|nr:hypothetical protein NM208_g947 [Fusarium decemcellulare]